MIMKETWTRKEVSEKTGITDRRILFYSEQNILPGFKKDVGRGTARTYSVQDIFYLLLLKELNTLGLSLTSIRKIIKFLYAWPNVFLPGMKLEKFNLWKNGTFTKEACILIISPLEKEGMSSVLENYNAGFGMEMIFGKTEFTIVADKPSKIVINLNQIYEKAVTPPNQ